MGQPQPHDGEFAVAGFHRSDEGKKHGEDDTQPSYQAKSKEKPEVIGGKWPDWQLPDNSPGQEGG